MSRYLPLLFLLLLAPSPVEREMEDCGLVPGQRYWIAKGGRLIGEDVVVEDATYCIIPEGVILSVYWDERPPRARLIAHASCTAAEDEEAKLSRMIEQARTFVRSNGFKDEEISVERAECATPRRLDVVVE